jgi:hypothetical protein
VPGGPWEEAWAEPKVDPLTNLPSRFPRASAQKKGESR